MWLTRFANDTTMTYEIDVQIDDAFATLVDSDWLRSAATRTLHHCKIEQAALTLVITDDAEVQALNAEFRGVDAATDVLSFPNQSDDESSMGLVLPPELVAETESYLGDVVIAFPYSAKQAANYANPISDELCLLTVHGVLHLLGYDHASEEEEVEMWAIQDSILQTLGVRVDLTQRVYE